MISKSLSTSQRYASLHQHAGKLAEFSQTLYVLLVTHADDYGRLDGDVFTVKHQVFPISPRKLRDFEQALYALHQARLIRWYVIADKWYIQISEFDAHQTGLHKRTEADRPAPPDEEQELPEPSGNFPESPAQLKGTELNRTELNTAGEETPALPVGEFIKRFCELYSKHRHGAKYHVQRKRDVTLVRALLKDYGLERLIRLAAVMLLSDDPWLDGTDRGIGILSVKASWCDERLAEAEAHQAKAS